MDDNLNESREGIIARLAGVEAQIERFNVLFEEIEEKEDCQSDDQSCKSCAFARWVGTWECRKKAPGIFVNAEWVYTRIFPRVDSDDWCGDWKANRDER